MVDTLFMVYVSERDVILFRRADTFGNECLDFFFGRQLDVVFLHKQIRIQATCYHVCCFNSVDVVRQIIAF